MILYSEESRMIGKVVGMSRSLTSLRTQVARVICSFLSLRACLVYNGLLLVCYGRIVYLSCRKFSYLDRLID